MSEATGVAPTDGATVAPRGSAGSVLRILGAAVVVLGCAFALGRIDWTSVGGALRNADLSLVVLAAAINFVHLACKSERWRVMLEPIRVLSRLRLFYYLLVAYAASAVLPARAGEVLRVYILRRRDGIPVEASIGVVVAEKLFEVLGLLLLVAPLPLVLALPRWISGALGVTAVGGLVGAVVTVVLALRLQGASGRWGRLAQGIACVRSPGRFARALAWSLAAWSIDAFEVWLILRAVHVEVPLAAPLLVLLTLNLAIAVPSTPGGVGAFEAGAVAGLHALGVPLAPALAFALVYHFMQVVPVVLAGLSGMRLVAEARAVEVDVAAGGA